LTLEAYRRRTTRIIEKCDDGDGEDRGGGRGKELDTGKRE
jgi:hypothetical protein